MIKTFHEAPKQIFQDVQRYTDGDYALVHLFEQDPEYLKLFKESLDQGREVILDNSVFELGSAWDPEEFAYWVRLLEPTYYIVPDVLNEGEATVEAFRHFIEQFPDLPGKRIGVMQGRTYEDAVQCYKAIEPLCDRVGISFDCAWYTASKPEASRKYWEQLMYGRIAAINTMLIEGVLNQEKEHHLLGVALPQEVCYYTSLQALGLYGCITSVDTSNPVVHGLKGIRYNPESAAGWLFQKESQKLCTMIDMSVTDEQWRDVEHNLKMFWRACHVD